MAPFESAHEPHESLLSPEPNSLFAAPSHEESNPRGLQNTIDEDQNIDARESLISDASSTAVSASECKGSAAEKDGWGGNRSKNLISSGHYQWNLEILAVVLSISSLVAILVLLPVFENQPLSAWQLPLSFNAVISILGAASRASLAFAISSCISQGKWNWYRRREDNMVVFDRFEEASRGPWGSLRLLWWTRLRQWTALGALSAVILVGFEPFLQAVITFSGEEVEFSGAESTATIGKTVRLDSGSVKTIDGSGIAFLPMPEPYEHVAVLPMRFEYDFGALAAVWEGFSDLNTADMLKPAFTCSTGNCTWNSFASLAVCSACNDISNAIKKTSGVADLTNATVITIPHDNHSVMSLNGTGHYTSYSITERNLSISNFNGLCSEPHNQVQSPSGKTSAFLTARSTLDPGETLSFRDTKTLIISFSMLQTNEQYRNRTQVWEPSEVTAEECALYFCTNIYETTVEQSTLKESVLGSFTSRNLDSFVMNETVAKSLPNIDRDKAFNEYHNYTLFFQGTFERTDLQLLISKDEYFSTTGINIDNDLRFNISYNTIGSLTRWFHNVFSPPTQLVYPDSFFRKEGTQPPVISSLGLSKNITRTFDNVAASLTKWMRNRSLQTQPYPGTGREWVIRIRVNWSFLTLPLTALVGGCIFCLLSIWETHVLGLPAWRGSSLATLAHGLNMDSRALLRDATDDAKIVAHARGLGVRFVDAEGGSELVHVTKDTRTTEDAA